MANGLGDIGLALSGLGAGIQGTGIEFAKQLDTRRKGALLQDALRVEDSLTRGDVGQARELLLNRIDAINRLNGDPSDTVGLLQKLDAGDVQGALTDASTVVEFARQEGLLKRPAAAEEFTLSPGQQRFRGGEIIAEVPAAPPAPPKERKTTEKERAEIAKIRAETARITQEARGLPKAEADILKQERTETIKKNVLRISDLSKGVRARTGSIKKARRFLRAFEKGQVTSGAGRATLSFIPGVFTKQAQFDEELDSFAEVAAREKLKAVGEIRPTDADVEGMKRALFGIGRDEQTNINLLQEFINEQEGLDDELDALRESKRTGQLSTFTGLQNQPIEVDF